MDSNSEEKTETLLENATAAFDNSNFEDAKIAIKKYLSINTNCFRGHKLYAFILWKLKDIESAQIIFEKSVKLCNYKSKSCMKQYLIILLYYIGDITKAKYIVRKYSKHRNRSNFDNRLMAYYYTRVNNTKKAKLYFNRFHESHLNDKL